MPYVAYTGHMQHTPIKTADQLGPYLRGLRLAAGMTQAQLGARLGVGQTRVARIEADPGALTVKQLLRVLHALGVDLLLGRDATAPATSLPSVSASSKSVRW